MTVGEEVRNSGAWTAHNSGERGGSQKNTERKENKHPAAMVQSKMRIGTRPISDPTAKLQPHAQQQVKLEPELNGCFQFQLKRATKKYVLLIYLCFWDVVIIYIFLN